MRGTKAKRLRYIASGIVALGKLDDASRDENLVGGMNVLRKVKRFIPTGRFGPDGEPEIRQQLNFTLAYPAGSFRRVYQDLKRKPAA